MKEILTTLILVGLFLAAVFFMVGLSIEASKNAHPNGVKYMMPNGTIGTQINWIVARDAYVPTYQLQWESEGKIFKAWFKGEELRRVVDVETNADHTY